MTTQLRLYNGAALALGERRLLAVDEECELRRALDDVWDSGEVKKELLEHGLWNFALRTVSLTYSPSIEPTFGYRYAFDRPEDWVRTAAMSGDEYFSTLLDYSDEQSYFFSDYNLIYVRYVSMDNDYGYDLSLWPPTFTRWAEHYLASRIALRVTQSERRRDDLDKKQAQLLTKARGIDGANEAVAYPPQGSWSRSRQSGQGFYGRRGW